MIGLLRLGVEEGGLGHVRGVELCRRAPRWPTHLISKSLSNIYHTGGLHCALRGARPAARGAAAAQAVSGG